jgi:hypothetical protein
MPGFPQIPNAACLSTKRICAARRESASVRAHFFKKQIRKKKTFQTADRELGEKNG